MGTLTDEQRQEIEKDIFAGRRLQAVKRYRAITGVDLTEAKRMVEDMEVDLRRRSPENFLARDGQGCFGVLVALASIGIVAVLVLVWALT